MKIPAKPPDIIPLLEGAKAKLLRVLIEARLGTTVRGGYLHWDELRHRTPPDGLDRESWWAGLKMARQGVARRLPLLDKEQRPFSFTTPEVVQIHLHHIDQDAAGAFRAPGEEAQSPARRDEYLIRSLIEESITSSQLEGAATTRKAAEAMLRASRTPRTHDERMIWNNFQAMKAIQGFKDEPISAARILELHRILVDGTLEDPADAGRLRRSAVHVISEDGAIELHDPPPFQELPKRLERLCAFANAGESDGPFVHPALRAILLHFMIGYDHPFVDGNGRTARALFYWSMLRSGYWLAEFISISEVLRKAPAQYQRAYLFTETDGGDTTYFLIHQLETIRKAIDALHAFLAQRQREQRGIERLIAPASRLGGQLNHRQRALLAHALKHPGEAYRINTHQGSYGVAYQTARTDLLSLVELGLLESWKEGRAMVFVAPEDLETRIAAQGRR